MPRYNPRWRLAVYQNKTLSKVEEPTTEDDRSGYLLHKSKSDTALLVALGAITKASWTAVLVLGAVAGFLINALSGDGADEGVRNLILKALKADFYIFIGLLIFTFGAFFTALALGLQTEKRKFLSNLSFVVAFFIVVGGIVYAAFVAAVPLKDMWDEVHSLSKADVSTQPENSDQSTNPIQPENAPQSANEPQPESASKPVN